MVRVDPGAQATDERPSPTPSRRRRWPWLVSIGVAAALVVVVIASGRSPRQDTVSPADVSSIAKAAVDKGLKDAKAAPPDSAVVYQAILPSLVLIQGDPMARAAGK
jgi:hypothetical protein